METLDKEFEKTLEDLGFKVNEIDLNKYHKLKEWSISFSTTSGKTFGIRITKPEE